MEPTSLNGGEGLEAARARAKAVVVEEGERMSKHQP